MDERSILLAQVVSLEREVCQIDRMLATAVADDTLRERVRLRFSNRIKPHRADLATVRQAIATGVALDACWDSFGKLKRKFAPIFEESLAFVEGLLARQAGIDGGLCDIADALLRDLDFQVADLGWWGTTVLAKDEFFQDLVSIIRLRFPETSIWNLPVAAHEFGHFVVQEIEEAPDGRYTEYLDRFGSLFVAESNGARSGPPRYLHEYYADLFATYALGPAYAYTCLLLRFDPVKADIDGDTHPRASMRAHLILTMLEQMNAAGRPAGAWTGLIKNLRAWWQANLAAAKPHRASPSEDMMFLLESLAEELHTRLLQRLPNVRYNGWACANRLRAALLPGGASRSLERNTTLADVLNAAWLCRINTQNNAFDEIDAIGEEARRRCLEIVAHC